MVNMLVYHLPKNPDGENLMIWHITLYRHCLVKKLYMRNLERKNSNKEKSTMYHMSQYHPPKPYGKNG
jgi:hypothetical protein